MAESAGNRDTGAIRQQMMAVRGRMPYDMDAARQQATQLTDWRYYVRRFPFATLGLTAAAAYMLVPHKIPRQSVPDSRTLAKMAERGQLVIRTEGTPKKASMFDMGLTAVTNLLLRAGTAYLSQRLGKVVGVQAAQPDHQTSRGPVR